MRLIYCPECKTDFKKLSETEYKCANGHQLWDNPKAAVTAILVKDGKVLCAKRGIEPNIGKYDFPGGFLNHGEMAEDGIKRELLEETSLIVNEVQLIDCYTHSYDQDTSVADLIYIVRNWQGEMVAKDDVEALEWQPVSFIDGNLFAWEYKGLSYKLSKLL